MAKGAPEGTEQPLPAPEPIPTVSTVSSKPRDEPPHLSNDIPSRPSNGPRESAPLYRQALAQAVPSTSPGQKRTRSARSPSPNGHANKSRRVDLPTGPRAMQQRDGSGPSGSRSLLDRMGPRNGRAHDDIQARIDSITGPVQPDMMMLQQQGGFPMNGVPGMDMAAMAGMGNPMMLQEMMMSQMAMMAQMAGAMGLLNPAAMGANGQFQGQPGVGDVGGINNGPNGAQQYGHDGRGRGRGRAGQRGTGGRGRGGHTPGSGIAHSESSPAPPASVSTPQDRSSTIAAPAPVHATAPAPQLTPSLSQSRNAGPVPERPQSPTLCKFGLKCTNAQCRYSHPSPVATPESGVVLSNDPCEAGKDCKDKDCVKAHVSPAVLKPNGKHCIPLKFSQLLTPSPYTAEHLNPKAPVFTPSAHHHSPAQSQVPCRFGAACTRPGCSFLHPPRPGTTPCRFGVSCTKATCPFQHPEGRSVLPSTFHRGLGNGAEITSHNKSVTFNNSKTQTAAELEKKLKEMEEKKNQAQAAVAQAQAAAAASKDNGAKSVPAAA